MDPRSLPPNNPTVGTVVVRENVVHDDVLAVEFPLFQRINARQPIILMRTPKTSMDSDHNLAYGFLYGERVIESLDDVRAIQHCDDAQNPMRSHTLNVSLESGCSLKSIQERRDPIYSACGACGRASLDDLTSRESHPIRHPKPSTQWICTLPEKLGEHQQYFNVTGGVHGAALFSQKGEMVAVDEDVGRHNAVDKVIGSILRQESQELSGMILVVTSRLSFDLVQKAARANLAAVAGVGAASSSAVELARKFGIHLFSFTHEHRVNYHDPNHASPAHSIR